MGDVIRAFRKMPGLYIPYLEPFWHEQELNIADEFLDSHAIEDGRASLQAYLESQFPNSKDIILTDTGKSALYVALKMLGVKQQDEVILPSYCCASVIASVLRSGCTPVLADTDQQFNISGESVVEALTPRSRAILVPHLFGLKAGSLEAIVALAGQRNIAVIEDVAQAFGLRLPNGVPAGSLGDAAIFSSGIGKPIMGPGGGWVVMNRIGNARPSLDVEPIEESRRKVKQFLRRFCGTRAKRGFSEIKYSLQARLAARLVKTGFDIHEWAHQECLVRGISNIDAWFAAGQIEHIEKNLALRRRHSHRWRMLLDAARIQYVTLPDESNVHNAFIVGFPGATGTQLAAQFRTFLEHSGITTESCYTPLHLREFGKHFPRTGMSTVEALWKRVFALPVRPNLRPTDWQRIEKVVMRAGLALAS
jgi:dTDP-4-amino-4,6-dideoxygalactose transaminase